MLSMKSKMLKNIILLKMGNKVLILFCSIIFCYSCNTINYLPAFDFTLFNDSPMQSLAKAVEKEDTEKINELCKNKSLNVDYQETKFGHSLLMLAVANNKINSVISLLKNGANPNLTSFSQCDNSLSIVCNETYSSYCDTVVFEMLLQYNGKIDFEQNYIENSLNGKRQIKSNLLSIAVSSGKCLEFIKYIVNKGVDINRYPDNDPTESAITYALLTDNLKIAKYLIIDKQATIPSYIFKREANISYKGEPEKYLTVTDLLNEQNYEEKTENHKLKEEIINYLKSKNLK